MSDTTNERLGILIIVTILGIAILQFLGVGRLSITFASLLVTTALALLGVHEGIRQSGNGDSRDDK